MQQFYLGVLIFVFHSISFRSLMSHISLCENKKYYYYNRGIQMYRFPNSDVQKSVIFEGIKKRLKIV